MTGYGRGVASGTGKAVTVELKAVNQRFLDIVVRIPRLYISLEEKIRRVIKKRLSRGRIEVFLSISEENEENRSINVDMGLVMAYYNVLKELAQNLDISADITASRLLSMPDVFTIAEPEWDEDSFWPVVNEALNEALEGLHKMRQAEGENLQNDLLKRANLILKHVEAIKQRAPQVPIEYAKRLKEKIGELTGEISLDPGRLEMEVAMMAERSDITEEVVRLLSHLEQINIVIEGHEPQGRRLDFILQEMWREINTIGSKANDLTISNLVVAVKGELEKMREQVQNVE
ncbi:MAG: hypothetical protein PWP31_682 [Clostridia bacterium]|nr:hypothetical protein [Clostridia bacterium]